MAQMDKDDLAARLEALETRAAHQDRTLDELNTAITAQWSTIDGLRRQLSTLGDRLAEAEDRAVAPPASQKPPHY